MRRCRPGPPFLLTSAERDQRQEPEEGPEPEARPGTLPRTDCAGLPPPWTPNKMATDWCTGNCNHGNQLFGNSSDEGSEGKRYWPIPAPPAEADPLPILFSVCFVFVLDVCF